MIKGATDITIERLHVASFVSFASVVEGAASHQIGSARCAGVFFALKVLEVVRD
jgi:hypothetical protein